MSARENVEAMMIAEAGISQEQARRVIESFIAQITGKLKQRRTVKLSGFGMFINVGYQARAGRNPRTGTAIRIRAKRVAVLRLYRKTKDRLYLGQIEEFPWLDPRYVDEP